MARCLACHALAARVQGIQDRRVNQTPMYHGGPVDLGHQPMDARGQCALMRQIAVVPKPYSASTHTRCLMGESV